jgi:hypothetical protein
MIATVRAKLQKLVSHLAIRTPNPNVDPAAEPVVAR